MSTHKICFSTKTTKKSSDLHLSGAMSMSGGIISFMPYTNNNGQDLHASSNSFVSASLF